MGHSENVLDRLKVASPCSAKWEEMEGDDRVRFCKLCELNVYNLSAMGREEAEALVENREGRLCARLYQRADGTIITQDCPVGLAAFRRRVRRIAGAFAAMIGILITGAISFGQGNRRSLGLRLRDVQPFVKVSDVLSPASAGAVTVTAGEIVLPSQLVSAGKPSVCNLGTPAGSEDGETNNGGSIPYVVKRPLWESWAGQR